MSLAPGLRLGAYEILTLLGAGGMGEVYRARDTRLGRDVAVKIVPGALSGDAVRLQRFEQEARAAAALNHPNILAVYDVGAHDGLPFIVSELLEGETLRERLKTGPLPVRKAIEAAIQIAQALAVAHEKGIVHRDLKPDNVFINRDGRAKVLDFGLAKLTQADSPLVGDTNAPTTPRQTQVGVVLGTIGYMAPEQVRAQAVDHRADVFAFGAILYEMLSGRRAFTGETTIDTMTSILKEDPPDLPLADRHIPPALARIVDRCLEKSPERRFHSMHDLAIALETLSSHSETSISEPSVVGRQRSRVWVPWAVAALAVIAASAAGGWMYVNKSVDVATYRSSLLPPEGVVIDEQAPSRLFALSPDGSRLAFVGFGMDRRRMLWVRSLDSLAAQQLTGTEDAFAPFWSPDGRSIGFFAANGGKLKRIDIDGGPPATLCDYSGAPGGADWNEDGVILFTTTGSSDGALRRVSASGGAPEIVLKADSAAGESGIWWPVFMPDNRRFLYLSISGARTARGVFAGSLDNAQRKVILKAGSNVRYANGRLLFLRNNTLMSQPFDPQDLELSGAAIPVAERIQMNPPTGAYSVSDNGVLVYKTGDQSAGVRLTWFDIQGRQLSTLGDAANYGDLQLSPDGRRAAVSLADSATGTRDVWTVDLVRELPTRFTFDASEDSNPVWSQNGDRIFFRSVRNNTVHIYERPSSGSAGETLVLSSKIPIFPIDVSSDGKFLLYSTPNAGALDLWALPMTGDDRKPFPVVNSRFAEITGRFSPDGRWIAYMSNESGRQEIYVTAFPGGGGKWQVSSSGGTSPIWSRNGRQIFYFSPGDAQLMAASVTASGAAVDIGQARVLFRVRPGGLRSFFDVAADGRFLFTAARDQAESPPLTLVVNWAAELERK